MQCPYCGGESSVTETRIAPDCVRRRRVCATCKRRFTTYEKVGAPGLKVEKRDGRIEPFDSGKLLTALRRIGKQRPNLRAEDLARVARDIEASLVDAGHKVVTWSEIVEQALRRLQAIDGVVASRLASNYTDESGALRLAPAPADAGEAAPSQLALPGVAADEDEA